MNVQESKILRILTLLDGFVKLGPLIAEVPFWLFAAALGLIRAGIGPVLLAGLGSCVYHTYVAERSAGRRGG